VDTLLLAHHALNGDRIETFDNQLNKLLGNK